MRTSGSFGIRSRFRRSMRSYFSHASVLELHLINLPIKFVEALRREVNVTSEHVSSQYVSSHALLIFSHASCCFEHLILSAGWTIKWPGFSSLSNQLRPLERERILGTFCIICHSKAPDRIRDWFLGCSSGTEFIAISWNMWWGRGLASP